MSEMEARLASLGLELPAPPQAAGTYIHAVQVGETLYLAGMTATTAGVRRWLGRVGAEVSVEEGRLSARAAALNCLAAAKGHLGDLDRIRRVVRVTGYVNSAPDFDQQHLVINGASELLEQLFGDSGRHVRSSLGVAQLPFRCSVELDVILQVE